MFSSNRFQDLLKGLSRGQFDRAVNHFQGDKYSKGFRCWDQFVAMAYGQISGARSLRELETGINEQVCQHYHLGTRSIKRSTLSEANAKRDYRIYKTLCEGLIAQVHRKQRKQLEPMLYLLDSTPIPLRGKAYDEWTQDNKTYRTKGLKTHVVIDGESDTPVFVEITPPNVNDIEIGWKVPIEKGATYVFDKGYYNYNWWYQINQQQACFVTRYKKNASVKLIAQLPVDQEDERIILSDEVVRFNTHRGNNNRANAYYEKPLRRVMVKRSDKETPLVLATNNFERPAKEIAQLYKQRWGIELFFKWLKQNLKLKSFLGQSENAVRTQIYIALITYLLVFLMRSRETFDGTLRTFLNSLKVTLFQRKETDYYRYLKRKKERDKLQHLQRALPI